MPCIQRDGGQWETMLHLACSQQTSKTTNITDVNCKHQGVCRECSSAFYTSPTITIKVCLYDMRQYGDPMSI